VSGGWKVRKDERFVVLYGGHDRGISSAWKGCSERRGLIVSASKAAGNPERRKRESLLVQRIVLAKDGDRRQKTQEWS